jgi:hypothetical protein
MKYTVKRNKLYSIYSAYSASTHKIKYLKLFITTTNHYNEDNNHIKTKLTPILLFALRSCCAA